MHLIALCCCVFHVLHVYLKNLKMNMTNYFLTFRFCFFNWILKEWMIHRPTRILNKLPRSFFRVCVSNTNPSGVSWWERLWADVGHENSYESQEDPWLSGFWVCFRFDCLHGHHWEYQVEYCVKSIMEFFKICFFSHFFHLLSQLLFMFSFIYFILKPGRFSQRACLHPMCS